MGWISYVIPCILATSSAEQLLMFVSLANTAVPAQAHHADHANHADVRLPSLTLLSPPRPTMAEETFSVVARTDVTLLCMSAKASYRIEPYFGLQFFLATNPHGMPFLLSRFSFLVSLVS